MTNQDDKNGCLDRGLSGDYRLEIGAVMADAIDNFKGIMGSVFLAYLYMFLFLIVPVGLAIFCFIQTVNFGWFHSTDTLFLVRKSSIFIGAFLLYCLLCLYCLFGCLAVINRIAIQSAQKTTIERPSFFELLSATLLIIRHLGLVIIFLYLLMIATSMVVFRGLGVDSFAFTMLLQLVFNLVVSFFVTALGLSVPVAQMNQSSPWVGFKLILRVLKRQWWKVVVLNVISWILIYFCMSFFFLPVLWAIPFVCCINAAIVKCAIGF